MISHLLYLLTYFECASNGHGPLLIKNKSMGLKHLFFYMFLGLLRPKKKWLSNGRPKISQLVVLIKIF